MNVKDKWLPEILHFCEGVPYLLVGLKSDLRMDAHSLSLLTAQGVQPVRPAPGERSALARGARRFVECAAMAIDGVGAVFQAALEEAFGAKKWKRGLLSRHKKCTVL